jgi:hypothetical protein
MRLPHLKPVKVSMPKLGGSMGAPKLGGMPKVGGEGLPSPARPGRVKPILHMASRLHLQGRSAFGPGSASGAAFGGGDGAAFGPAPGGGGAPSSAPGPGVGGGQDAPGAAGAAPGDAGG